MSFETDSFNDLVETVAEQTGRSEDFCRRFIMGMGSEIRSAVEAGQPVSIEGFGDFFSDNDELGFTPDSELSELLNAPFAHMQPEILEEKPSESEPEVENSATTEVEETIHAESDTKETGTHKPSIAFKNKYRRPQSSQSHLWIIITAFIILLLAASTWYLTGMLSETPSEKEAMNNPEMVQNSQTRQESQATIDTEADSAEGTGQNSQAAGAGKQSDQKEKEPDKTANTSRGQQQTSDNPIHTVTVAAGQTLWSLADNQYRNPYLWPWIYDTNSERIDDPDLIYVGQSLDIPLRRGDNESLSENDSLQVALAYVETYRWYKENKLDNARFYLYAAVKYYNRVFDHTTGTFDEGDMKFANRAR